VTTPAPTGTPSPTGTGTPAPTPTGTGTPSPAPSGTGQVPALQTGLAAEHAVIWGYGVVGAHAGDALLAQVRDADDAHRTLRDDAIALVARYGGTPVATQPEYALPFPVTDRASALRLAVHLEEGAAAAWRYAVAATDDVEVRRTALVALTDAAVRATRWRLALPTSPATVAFPGD
jgi:Domain of unknown function (DUF4439)